MIRWECDDNIRKRKRLYPYLVELKEIHKHSILAKKNVLGTIRSNWREGSHATVLSDTRIFFVKVSLLVLTGH